MQETREITCRYGVTYTHTFSGGKPAVDRCFDLMTHCCCWVCHNHNCTMPRNEILPDCEEVCKMYTHFPYCKAKKNQSGMNKEVEYGYVLFRKDDNKLYCFRDGQDGVCTTLHAATKFDTEKLARIKRDQLYKQYQKMFDIKRVVIEYAMYNL